MTAQSRSFSVKLSAAVTGAALTAILVSPPSPVTALTLVTQRTTLGANDQIDWSSLGLATPFLVLPNSFEATSAEGLGLTVEIPLPAPGITPPLVFQTLPPPTGIPTNFAPGDFILLTGFMPGSFPAAGNPGPLSITFDTPVRGAGAQIAVDDTFSFTGFISAFDSSDTLLGTFSAAGTSSLALDNSALFLGVLSDEPNIQRLVFNSSEPGRAFGINTLSIEAAPVPEPGSVFALSLLGLGAIAFRNKGAKALQ